MLLSLLFQGQIELFLLIVIALIISLTFHEFGHAVLAKFYGDDTAERAGRLTLNPLAHIDPMGFLMVLMVGFGYAKPVPTNPRNFRSRWAELWVAFAGPGMNLLLAVVIANIYALGVTQGWSFFSGEGPRTFFQFLAFINLILALFNLIPLGALDGHYILPYFLPRDAALRYLRFNAQYGNLILLSVIVLAILGVPIFQALWTIGGRVLQWLVFV